MRRLLALYAAFALSSVPACRVDTSNPPAPSRAAVVGLADHDPALAHRLVADGALLLDVRTLSEYSDRHIDGAINIPVDDLQSRAPEVSRLTGGDMKKPIVVYCGSGKRAARAKTILQSQGYDAVTNLGGIDDWDRK